MGRAPCCDKNGLKKGPWTPEEDQKLIDYIQKHGYGNWRTLPNNAGLQRCGKSCRLRWTNYLRPDIKRGRISLEEEETIIQLHSVLGNKWSTIAASLPGRTDNELKNYWNTHIRKRLLRMGIDPVTHSPRLDLLDLSSIQSSSLYNSSQMNMLRLLGIQHLLNPMLHTTLLSSQHETHNFLLQNGPENHIQNQYGPLFPADQFQTCQVKEMPTCTALTTALSVPVSNEAQPIMDHNVEQQPFNLTDLGLQSSQLRHNWQSSKMASSLQDDSSYYGSDQTIIMDPPSDASTFILNNSVNNFSFGSVISTDSSSPTPLNSNSPYISGGYPEDDRESHCSNMLKFEIPDILDISKFMSY